MERLHDCLRKQSRLRPSKRAWVEQAPTGTRVELTWANVEQLAEAMAAHLLHRGVQQNDRVVQWSHNSLEWVLIDLACSLLGACHVPLDPRLDDSQAGELINRVRPRVSFVESSKIDMVADASEIPSWKSLQSELPFVHRVPSEPSKSLDLANILFTSGTSASPRGVMLSHRNLISNAIGKLDAMPQYPEDHRVNLLPFSHAYARTCELTTWLISGSSLEVVRGREEFWNRLAIARPTLVNLVPLVFHELYERWERHGSDQQHLCELTGGQIRQWASGGAAIDESIRDKFASLGLPIHQGYGLTETSPVVCSNRSAKAGSLGCYEGVGPPVLGMECRIDSDSRLWVRGNGVMMGYWEDVQGTQEKLQDGWLDTGDLAVEMEKSGALKILGRADDLLVLSNGYKVHPNAIEACVRSMPGVRDCILIQQGGARCRLVVNIAPDTHLTSECILKLVRAEESLTESNWVHEVVLVTEDWDSDRQLVNFKGGKRRVAFQHRFGSR